MSPVATVLYEDSMRPGAGGSYPLHDLVMRMVEDEINGQTWELARAVAKNPRNGIGNLIRDVQRTALLAGDGTLFLLADVDRIAEHLKVAKGTSEAALVVELRQRSDAPDRLCPFFLRPNLEGVLRAIQSCEPNLSPDSVAAALRKALNERDIVFNALKKATHREVRGCVRRAQPGLDGLVLALAASISARSRGR